MTDLSPILAELERLYDVAADLFHGGPAAAQLKQDKPIITLASKGRNRTRVGWYTPGVWNDTQEDVLAGLAGVNLSATQTRRAEIVVATELLNTPYLAVAEMCRQQLQHLNSTYDNPYQGVRLVGANGYYPERWTRLAYTIGCKAEVDPEQPSRGWSKLSIGSKFTDKMVPLINMRVFDLARLNAGTKAPVGSRMKKWTCRCTTVRCATELQSRCVKCHEPMVWAEKNEPNPYAVREQNDDNSPPWPAAAEPNYTSPNPNTPAPLGKKEQPYSVTEAYLRAWNKTYANNPTTEAGGA